MRTLPDPWTILSRLLDPIGLSRGDTPAIEPAQWLDVYALATANLVAPTLFASLEEHGWPSVPPEIREALEANFVLNDDRNTRIASVLRHALICLGDAGITAVPLKGAVALLPGQYPHARARMMNDIDIAIAAGDAERAAEALMAQGYAYLAGCHPDVFQALKHLAPLVDPSDTCRIELHRTLFDAEAIESVLSLEAVVASARLADWDGLPVRVPTVEHRILHNVLHHQFTHLGFSRRRLALSQLLEFARLRQLPEGACVSWADWLEKLDRRRRGDGVRAYLLSAHALFGQPLPDGVRITRPALRAERALVRRRRAARIYRYVDWVLGMARRLPYLPLRLMTPSWYPKKFEALRARWTDRHRRAGEATDE
jgi:hypothetical protein